MKAPPMFVVLRQEKILGVVPYSVHSILMNAEETVVNMQRAGIECGVVEVVVKRVSKTSEPLVRLRPKKGKRK